MSQTTVLHVGGLHWATSEHAIESALARRAGVEAVEANATNQSATVTYDPSVTSVEELRRWVTDCGYHCAGQSVPEHICDPLMEPGLPGAAVREEAEGDGGHAEMSMAAMVADMRNRFVVAALFSIPIVLWSPIGRDIFGFEAAVPFGLREDVFTLILSLPVIFYSCSIFFTGAVRALRARTLDMMVLVAVAVTLAMPVWVAARGVIRLRDCSTPQRIDFAPA